MLKFTGNKISLERWEKEKRCSRCGKSGDRLICEECHNLKKCPVCGIFIREPEYYYYLYKVNSDRYIEFKYKVKRPYEVVNGMCKDCTHTQETQASDYIENYCYKCNREFKNTYKNYLTNGNYCEECCKIIELWIQQNGRISLGLEEDIIR